MIISSLWRLCGWLALENVYTLLIGTRHHSVRFMEGVKPVMGLIFVKDLVFPSALILFPKESQFLSLFCPEFPHLHIRPLHTPDSPGSLVSDTLCQYSLGNQKNSPALIFI